MNEKKEGRFNFVCHAGGRTDSGSPTRENQDEFFIVRDPSNPANLALGLFDGHGKELGHVASAVAKKYFLAQFAPSAELNQQQTFQSYHSISAFERIRHQPETTLRRFFKEAHELIKRAYRMFYEKSGYSVKEEMQGAFLTKRLKGSHAYSCVHGGATATIIVILDGSKIYAANSGDSSAIFGGMPVAVSDLNILDSTGPAYSSYYSRATSRTRRNSMKQEQPPQEPSELSGVGRSPILLTGDHSPECETEFYRIRNARKSDEDPNTPELTFMYDSPSFNKYDRTPIFIVDSTGTTTLTNDGKYYKNVRNEWASLVATPHWARFQDALAFTRSLGDFHLHAYGVTYEPDITEFNLESLLIDRIEENTNSGKKVDKKHEYNFVICAGTDGLWDNWKYAQLSEHLLTSDRIKSSVTDSGAKTIANALIETNLQYAKDIFGNHADNMTAVVCYINAKIRP